MYSGKGLQCRSIREQHLYSTKLRLNSGTKWSDLATAAQTLGYVNYSDLVDVSVPYGVGF